MLNIYSFIHLLLWFVPWAIYIALFIYALKKKTPPRRAIIAALLGVLMTWAAVIYDTLNTLHLNDGWQKGLAISLIPIVSIYNGTIVFLIVWALVFIITSLVRGQVADLKKNKLFISAALILEYCQSKTSS